MAEVVREGKRQLGIVRNEQRYLGTGGRIKHGTVIKDLSLLEMARKRKR